MERLSVKMNRQKGKLLQNESRYLDLEFTDSGVQLRIIHSISFNGTSVTRFIFKRAALRSDTANELTVVNVFASAQNRPYQVFTKARFGLKQWLNHFHHLFNRPVLNYLKFCSGFYNYMDISLIREALNQINVDFMAIDEQLSNSVTRQILSHFHDSQGLSLYRNPFERKEDIVRVFVQKTHSCVYSGMHIDLNHLLAMNAKEIRFTSTEAFMSVNDLNKFIKLWRLGSNRNIIILWIDYAEGHDLDEKALMRGIDHTQNQDERWKRACNGRAWDIHRYQTSQ